MTGNFFLQDVLGGALAVLLLTCVLVLPGWVLGWSIDVCGFRARGPAARAALSVVLSVATTPAVVYLVSRATTVWAAAAAAAALAVGAAALGAGNAVRGGGLRTVLRGLWAHPSFAHGALVCVAWAVIALLLLSDTQFGSYLYPNIVAFDYAKHISVTDAITRTGVPPVNPSFRPGHDIALYYYYYWFLVCSVADVLGGSLVSARAAVIGGTVWAGVALMSVVALYLRFVLPPLDPGAIGSTSGSTTSIPNVRRIWTGVLLLVVGGLDILGALFAPGPAGLTLEWWNEQVTAWPNAVLWVPHHVGAFVATLTGFLLLRDAEQRRGRGRAAIAALCGLSFASAAGMSVWVTLTFALFWGVWIAVCLARGWRAEAGIALAAGVVALAAAAPFLLDLARANMLHQMPIAFSVRAFSPLDRILDATGAGDVRRQVYRLMGLPLNYLLELGFFAVAAAFYWRTRARAGRALGRALGRGEVGLLVMSGVGIVVASFVKSAIRSNDLGWRSMMFVQFAVLLWAVDVIPALAAGTRTRVALPAGARRVLLAMMALGTAAVVYDAAAMKLYPAARVAGSQLFGSEPWSARENGRRMHDIRAAYEWINDSTPPGSLVQPNPFSAAGVLYVDRAIDVFQGLYGARAVVAGDPEYGTLYGIPRPMFDSIAVPIAAAFAARGMTVPAAVCRRHGLSALLVKETDPVWRAPSSWAWQARASYANASARIVPCAALVDRTGRGALSGAVR